MRLHRLLVLVMTHLLILDISFQVLRVCATARRTLRLKSQGCLYRDKDRCGVQSPRATHWQFDEFSQAQTSLKLYRSRVRAFASPLALLCAQQVFHLGSSRFGRDLAVHRRRHRRNSHPKLDQIAVHRYRPCLAGLGSLRFFCLPTSPNNPDCIAFDHSGYHSNIALRRNHNHCLVTANHLGSYRCCDSVA